MCTYLNVETFPIKSFSLYGDKHINTCWNKIHIISKYQPHNPKVNLKLKETIYSLT